MIKTKIYLELDVYQKALERIRYLYSVYDNVAVSFSGGKDSTALLLCTIDVAREIGRLPVRAVFYDEEAIHPPTIDYVARVRDRGDVSLEWYCLQVQHRNACSNTSPYWRCWEESKKDLWIREKPPWAISEHPEFKLGMSMQEFGIAHFRNTNTCAMQGIRTEESIRRYRAVSRKKNDNYITFAHGAIFAYPIYDWGSKDVWKLVDIKGEDYNRTYDVYNRTRHHERFLNQRVCPPYGEEPIRGLSLYAECFPDMWQKMVDRVPGAATAARYGNTELYSRGYKPDGLTWRQHVENVIESYSPEYQDQVKKAVNEAITRHKKRTANPIPQDEPHLLTGCSWKFLCRIVTRGDFKARVIGGMSGQAVIPRERIGMTLRQAREKFGR